MITRCSVIFLVVAATLASASGVGGSLGRGHEVPPFTEITLSQGAPVSGKTFIALTAIPTAEGMERLSPFRFMCQAFVARKLVLRGGEVVKRVGAKEIGSIDTEQPKPVVCAWKIPARSRGKWLHVFWTWQVFDTVTRTGESRYSNAGLKIR
jgi:hypothetical protein